MSESELQVLKNIDKKLSTLNHPPIWRYFVQGLLTGLGTVIGATILLAFVLGILRPFINAPVIGEWISNIVDVVEQNQGR